VVSLLVSAAYWGRKNRRDIRALNYPVLNAFLDDDDVFEITIRSQGSGFVHLTYSKQHVDPAMAMIAGVGNIVSTADIRDKRKK